MSRQDKVVYLLAFLIVGILISDYLQVSLIIAAVLLAVSLLLLIIFINKKGLVWLISLFVFFSLGLYLTSYQINDLKSSQLYKLANKKAFVAVKGYVCSKITSSSFGNTFTVKTSRINYLGKDYPNSELILVSSKSSPVYGQSVLLEGRVLVIEGKAKSYYYRQKVQAKITPSRLTYLFSSKLKIIGKIRQNIKRHILVNKDAPRALMLGALTGDISAISDTDKDNLRSAGLAHMWSVSGLHVGVIVLGLLFILRFLKSSPRLQIILVALSLLFYSALSGFAPPVLRSSVMAIMLLLAWINGRKKNILTALAASMFILLIYDPFMLFSLSFILSCLAIFFLIYLSPIIFDLLKDLPSKLKNALSVSLAAQIGVAPLIGLCFGQLSLSAVVVNILAVPALGPLMFFTVFSPTIGRVFALYILKIAYVFANFSFSWVYFPTVPIWLVVLYYPAIIFVFKYFKQREITFRFNRVLIIVLVFVCTVSFWSLGQAKPAGLKVTFINVGQGDSILIQNQGYNSLIDGGADRSQVKDYLLHRGIKTLDLVVLTHGDHDHIGGLLATVDSIRVKLLVCNSFPSDSSEQLSLMRLVKHKSIKKKIVNKGDLIKLGQARFYILSPTCTNLAQTENNHSVVIKLTYGQARFLFTGDIDSGFEQELLPKADLSCDVLKVAHHGSGLGTSKNFLQEARPKLAVISVGHNEYGHPNRSLLSRIKGIGSKIYRTDKDGTIVFTSNGRIISSN
ncbi:MAG: DNA internalization-related competence protein ComEC/Rec2 [Actinobacteria bacterium]|nr:MAG: DNA internalization-related competence protein ComEC/Rec2 [Actinomycetota bacterium]